MDKPFHPDSFRNEFEKASILVVGAGGIGCEVLKNLVLTGFNDIEIIDLDTIDLSNLNRQFLFQRKHVGKSKALVAKESALNFNPLANIVAQHGSITSPEYGVSFFKRFSLVINALDNRAARNHVNRLCLAADIPLLESGTAGYIGQSTVIKKNKYKCYECDIKAPQRTYPGCTIRNTPSEPIHCIVWAKHLFNQLFGEADPDEDVSPDTADPEASGSANGNVIRVSTRAWAVSCEYDPHKVFCKLFHDDIQYLLTMDKLWKNRRPPTPIEWDKLPDAVAGSSKSESHDGGLKEQQVLSIKEYCNIFQQCCISLANQVKVMGSNDHIVWDKDDDLCMDFVASCANIRAHIFGIPIKSRFDIKSMAGNIIPAIATTNAVIAGLLVLEALKVLSGNWSNCRTTYLNKKPINKKLIVPALLESPVSTCIVCSERPELTVRLKVSTLTLKTLEDKILKATLNMLAPDVEIDGRGVILISSEEGETEENLSCTFQEMQVLDGTVLKCDDFLQEYTVWLTILNSDELPEGEEFEIVGELDLLRGTKNKLRETETKALTNGSSNEIQDVEDNDITEVAFDESICTFPKKRKLEDRGMDLSIKKQRVDEVITL